MTHHIERVGAFRVRPDIPALCRLLRDTVDHGASIGFIPPLSASDALDYWSSVTDLLARGTRVLLVAREDDGSIVGSVQLDLARQANGQHRAEVMKFIVHPLWRGQGIGRALLRSMEEQALVEGRTLLVLDTERNSTAQGIYRRSGYRETGIIPNFALGADGNLHDTVILYKQLQAEDRGTR